MKYLFYMIMALALYGCKKYPEGGSSYLAKKHLYNKGSGQYISSKKWVIQNFIVNGIDSIDYIKEGNQFTSYSNKYYEFSFENVRSYYGINVAHQERIKTDFYRFYCDLNARKKKLWVFYAYKDMNEYAQCRGAKCERNILAPEGEQVWDVIKLTDDDLIIASSRINSYRLRFIAS